jgi:hypothetical protein
MERQPEARMSDPSTAPPAPPAVQVVRVFAAGDIFVTQGVNRGDGLGAPDALCCGDIYQLDPEAAPRLLALAEPASGRTARQQSVAAGSEVGTPGDPVTLLAQLTLMAPDGDTASVLVLHCPGARGGLLALPLAPLAPRTDYTLVHAGEAPEAVRLADVMCLSFLRGTRITLATGAQVPVEQLSPGDRVLTRDHGPQPVRWIGRATLRARGDFAPVVIPAGTMGNAGDLCVGPHHRLFLYLRDRPAALPTAEILVQARHLVDGERIVQREGGFADWFSLVFDRHEIIYAEGIPAESLMVTEATVARLPEALAEAVRKEFPGLTQRQHFGTEAGREALDAWRRANPG